MANGISGNGAPKPVRCAIYTRKSTDEGLNQDFNSLDAQRDAGEAYIRSQAGEGWTAPPMQYDDGGYTGANMDRPALKRLLADVQAGRVNCVVVYKVDRLTRSLFDFARIIEVLDKHGASFVAVTQQFNTTTSLGRLTLNILLSFAQFEREIISERIRDYAGLARLGHVTRAGITQIMNLLNLALDIQDEVLHLGDNAALMSIGAPSSPRRPAGISIKGPEITQREARTRDGRFQQAGLFGITLERGLQHRFARNQCEKPGSHRL